MTAVVSWEKRMSSELGVPGESRRGVQVYLYSGIAAFWW